MILFKSCPRCHGDLYDDKDYYGPFIICVQCGFHRDPEKRNPRDAGHQAENLQPVQSDAWHGITQLRPGRGLLSTG